MSNPNDLLPPSPAGEPSSASVFGSRMARSAVVGNIPCPQCGNDIPYAVRQIGRDVDCPHCGRRGVQVGPTLAEENRRRRAQIVAPFSVMMMKPPRLTRRGLALTAICVCVVAAVGGAVLATSSSTVFSEGWLNWKSVSAQEGETPEGTADVDTSQMELTPPQVTMELIEALLTQEDGQEALMQAQVWLQMLKDHGIGDDDPRIARLKQIIEQLGAQLAPKPLPPPVYLEEFRAALKALRQALIDEDLGAARRALAIAESLFAEHPDELDAYGASLMALKKRFQDQELLVNGRERIRELLVRAETRIAESKPTEAAEDIAEAMFLALRTPMEDAEFEQRSETVRSLEPDLRFARGKRAVEEAEQCHNANDVEAREKQLLVAYDLLPDLPAGRVEGLLKRAHELQEKTIATPTPSAVGRELAFRDAYEEALRVYGQLGRLQELADRCVEAQRLHEATTLDRRNAEKVGDLILNSLEFEVGDLLSRSSRSEDVAVGLAQARTALDAALPWQTMPRWRQIDSSLRNKSNEVALAAIAVGKQRAAEKDFAGALRFVEPATKLAGPELRPEAERLLNSWRNEWNAQVRAAAEEAGWVELRRLYRENKLLETWSAMRQFEEQFSDSKHLPEFPRIRNDLRPRVDAEVTKAFQMLEVFRAEENWPQYREKAEQISSAPLSAADQQRLALVNDFISKMTVEADRRFRATSDLRRGIIGSEDAVVALLEELPAILALNPDHKEAEQFLKQVNEQAEKRAGALLLEAGSKMRLANKALPRSLLQRATRLDPGGQYGKRAAELLRQLDAAGS